MTRKLARTGILVGWLGWTLAAQGCGNGHSATEPGAPVTPATRGNWIGTITGTNAGIHLQGTCPLEMNLDLTLSGQWWIDCPGASSTGQVVGANLGGISLLLLTTTSPASSCPWTATPLATPALIQGTFEVDDCATHQRLSSGTLTLQHR
jgi:hypothetical protein